MKRIAIRIRIFLISEDVSGDISWGGGGIDWSLVLFGVFELFELFGILPLLLLLLLFTAGREFHHCITCRISK